MSSPKHWKIGVKKFFYFFAYFSISIFLLVSLPISETKGRGWAIFIAEKMGWTQNWSMFAPEPLKLNLHVFSNIRFKNNRTKTWRMVFLDGYFQAWRSERTRKWIENLRLDSNRHLWEPYANFVAKQYQNSPEIESIELQRVWIYTVDPKKRNRGWFQPLERNYPKKNQYVFYQKAY